MAKADRPALPSEQAMQRAGFAGQRLRESRVDQAGGEQLRQVLPNRFGQPRRRLAGRGGEQDAWRGSAIRTRELLGEQDQRARHRRGLAGARAAGQQQESLRQRRARGIGLRLVDAAVGGSEQLRDARRQRIAVASWPIAVRRDVIAAARRASYCQ